MMPKKIVLLLALFYLACEKGEDITLATSLLESRLGVNASADPLEGNALFFQDVRYGNGERNTLDILLPDAAVLQGVVLFFHGGGFVSGDKADAFSDLLKSTMQQLLDNNIGIVSANYSFINTSDNSGVLSSLEDGTAALDFIRSHMEVLQIPRDKIILAGVSAGAGIAQWNGFREASNQQVQGILALAAQSTYNLYEWEQVFPELNLDDVRNSNAELDELFIQFYKGEPSQSDLEALDYRTFMDANDPPVYVFNQADDAVFNAQGELDFDVLYHSFRHGDYIRSKAIEVGLPFSGIYAESPDGFVLRVLNL
jgi:hypothetical protein